MADWPGHLGLLALPTSRMAIVTAKFTVAAVWSVLLAIAALLGLLIGAVLGLPGGRPRRSPQE